MHIDGWSIDAFGALQDVERRGIGEGLTVIHGPNEAGKSTLRHFVLGVLFGFTSGNTKNPLYAPAAGTARSGRLFIESDGEEFVLSRLEKRGSRAGNMTLLGPDGTARSDAELGALLGGLTRGVYDKVFAVGLDELNDLAALTDGDLQDHLLSAGVTGAGRIATHARNQLRSRADNIHRARAQSTEVAAIRESLRAVEDRLRIAQQAATDLGERRESLAAKRVRSDELAGRERIALARAQRAERLIELWPSYLEAAEAAATLEEMGDAGVPLPADAAEALGTRLAAVDASGAELETRQGDLDRALSQLKVLEAGHLPDLAALQPDIAALQHRLSGWAQQEEEVLRRGDELTELHRRLEFELDVIGVERASDLARVGAAVAARDHLRVTRSAFDEKAAARQRAAEDLEMQNKELMEAEAAIETGTAALAGTTIDIQHGSIRIESERAAREALLLGELSTELTELDQRRRDLAVAEGKARSFEEEPSRARSLFEPHRILVAVAVLLAMGAVVVGIMTGAVAGVAVGVTAAVVGGCAFGLRNVGGERLDENGRQGLVAVSNALERRCTDRARMLGFASLPTLDEVAEAKATRDQQAADLAALVTAQNRYETARSTTRAKKQRLAELTQAHETAMGAWQEWLGQHHLPTALRPEGVDEWLSHLDQARVLDDQIRQAERREHELQAALEYAPKAVIELTERAERASRPMGGDERSPRVIPVSITPPSVDSSIGELQAVVAAISALVSEAAATDHEVARVRDQVEVLRSEHTRATKARKSAAAELAAYLASAGVLNEAQLRRRLADQERRSALTATIKAFDRRLSTASGAQADDDRAALAERSPDAWTAERASALAESAALNEERDVVLRELGAIEGEVASIESSADLPALALEREALVERLQRCVREWTVLHVAAGLIGHTLDRYLDERQPAVLQRAETHLNTITEGRYRTIRLDPDATGNAPRLMVVDEKGRSHEPRGLSRGTVEQVYLCLRLALAEQHRPALPLLLDDILVNFDPIRAETSTRVLAEVAANQQVIVFTCHPWVVEVMQGVVPDLGLVDLGSRVA
jgi:uncharacterized protein YhaN